MNGETKEETPREWFGARQTETLTLLRNVAWVLEKSRLRHTNESAIAVVRTMEKAIDEELWSRQNENFRTNGAANTSKKANQ